jgi:hypothetical protein
LFGDLQLTIFDHPLLTCQDRVVREISERGLFAHHAREYVFGIDIGNVRATLDERAQLKRRNSAPTQSLLGISEFHAGETSRLCAGFRATRGGDWV